MKISLIRFFRTYVVVMALDKSINCMSHRSCVTKHGRNGYLQWLMHIQNINVKYWIRQRIL